MTPLALKHCVPCREGAEPLKEPLIREYCEQLGSGWVVVDSKKLVREVKMKNFQAVIKLVNGIAGVAEAEGHHPNMAIHDWNRLTLELYTHKIGGLHENDFILAKKIDDLLME